MISGKKTIKGKNFIKTVVREIEAKGGKVDERTVEGVLEATIESAAKIIARGDQAIIPNFCRLNTHFVDEMVRYNPRVGDKVTIKPHFRPSAKFLPEFKEKIKYGSGIVLENDG